MHSLQIKRILVAFFQSYNLAQHTIASITIPITPNIRLAKYEGVSFGVFGWCTMDDPPLCTDAGIGYYSKNLTNPSMPLNLPSYTDIRVSKLLVVHPVAVLFEFILWLMTLLNFSPTFNGNLKFSLAFALFSLPTFLLSLLCLLVDVLLFIDHLSWPGWNLYFVTILNAVVSYFIWNFRRTMIIIKYERLNNNVGTLDHEDNQQIEMHSMLEIDSISDDGSLLLVATNQSKDIPLLQPTHSYIQP